jgi:regulator of sigma E protease
VIWPIIFTGAQLEGIGKLFAKLAAGDSEAANNVQSVVGMTNILADSMETSPQVFLFLLIQISIALGLFNLLPFPALDGGRLVFLGYELITRRRPNERFEAMVHTVGILFLLGVLVLVTFRDIVS